MNHRIRFVSLALLCLALLHGIHLKGQHPKAGQPNIIVFLVDDMGWQDTSVPFWSRKTPLNERYRTPNMERMAAEGVKFTNAYAAPVCTPTRVSLITGLNAAHHRVTNWTNISKDTSTDRADDTFEGVDWNINGFSPVPGVAKAVVGTPLPLLLKEAGYFTIHVGKAHWGSQGTPAASPLNVGFIVNVGGHAAGHPQSYFGEQNYGRMLGKTTFHAVPDLEEYYGSETFLTEALTQKAIQAMDYPVSRKQPFFLYMGHYALHTPIQGDARYLQRYLAMGLDSTEAKYASLVEGMDKSLGDIMDFLQKSGQEKNTVILFMSDNGGLSMSPPRGGTAHTHNLPLREGKGSLHEGGIRVPMLVKWPGVVKPGTVQDQYVMIEDFFPSILEMAEVKNYRAIQPIDGKSFVPLLKNPELRDSTRTLIWHYPNKWGGGTGNAINYASAIRKGNWKLIYLMKKQKLELYDLGNDIGETTDLVAKFPEKARELAGNLTEYLKRWNAQRPVYKATRKEVLWPDDALGQYLRHP